MLRAHSAFLQGARRGSLRSLQTRPTPYRTGAPPPPLRGPRCPRARPELPPAPFPCAQRAGAARRETGCVGVGASPTMGTAPHRTLRHRRCQAGARRDDRRLAMAAEAATAEWPRAGGTQGRLEEPRAHLCLSASFAAVCRDFMSPRAAFTLEASSCLSSPCASRERNMRPIDGWEGEGCGLKARQRPASRRTEAACACPPGRVNRGASCGSLAHPPCPSLGLAPCSAPWPPYLARRSRRAPPHLRRHRPSPGIAKLYRNKSSNATNRAAL